MSDVDHGIAASLGAALGAAVVTADRILAHFRGKKKPELPPESPSLAGRVGRLYEQHMHLDQELKTMRQEFAQKLDRLSENVEELTIARAKTDELLPVIRDQLRELRDDMRQQRRGDK